MKDPWDAATAARAAEPPRRRPPGLPRNPKLTLLFALSLILLASLPLAAGIILFTARLAEPTPAPYQPLLEQGLPLLALGSLALPFAAAVLGAMTLLYNDPGTD